jgi:hypothetical protein
MPTTTDAQKPLYRLFLTSELRNLYLDVPVAIVSALCLYPSNTYDIWDIVL